MFYHHFNYYHLIILTEVYINMCPSVFLRSLMVRGVSRSQWEGKRPFVCLLLLHYGTFIRSPSIKLWLDTE